MPCCSQIAVPCVQNRRSTEFSLRPRLAGVAPITKPQTPGTRVVRGDQVTAGGESARSASAYGAGDRARLFEYAVRQTAESLLDGEGIR
jgi:hypothetical protein